MATTKGTDAAANKLRAVKSYKSYPQFGMLWVAWGAAYLAGRIMAVDDIIWLTGGLVLYFASGVVLLVGSRVISIKISWAAGKDEKP